MSITVGNTINYKGGTYLCISIRHMQEQMLASLPWEEMRAEMVGLQNVRFLNPPVFDEFEKHDIINVDLECCMLQKTGQDLQIIYTKYEVRKENFDGVNGSTQGTNEAANPAAQANDQRPAGGEGAR